jgi:hypothetical protein
MTKAGKKAGYTTQETAAKSELLDGWINREHLAADLGVCMRTIYRYEQDGLPYMRIGHRRYYNKAKALDWLINRESVA